MINPVLDIAQLKSIIAIIFKGKTLRIDRIVKDAGVHCKSCWVSYFRTDGTRWSTFLSKLDLQLAFWRWLCTIDLWKLNHNDRLHLGWAIYIILQPGDAVFHGLHASMGVVVDKRLTPKSKYPEILINWGGLEPCWESAVWLETF